MRSENCDVEDDEEGERKRREKGEGGVRLGAKLSFHFLNILK